jgi:DNA-binding SARP family transcriptional activator
LALADTVEVDLHDVVARAQRLIHGGGRRRFDDLAHLTEAGADLLPDWYDDWVLIERERFRQLRLSALECLCVELTAEHCYPQAVEAGVSAIAADPLRESAHRVLISAHLAAGNSGEALRQYRFCRSLLAQRLGTEPSLEMRTLARALPRSRGRRRAAGVRRRLRTRER